MLFDERNQGDCCAATVIIDGLAQWLEHIERVWHSHGMVRASLTVVAALTDLHAA